MATVENVQLTIGPGIGERQRAHVSYDIEFTETEAKLNIPFDEVVVLYERDDGPDSYVEVLGEDMLIASEPAKYAYGSAKFLHLSAPADGKDTESDDYIGIVGRGVVFPQGRKTVRREYLADWFFPPNESGPEEYRALVWILPHIRRGSAWSNEVVVNLK
jgi:hypothetical protein